jgi:hypothetical protein
MIELVVEQVGAGVPGPVWQSRQSPPGPPDALSAA